MLFLGMEGPFFILFVAGISGQKMGPRVSSSECYTPKSEPIFWALNLGARRGIFLCIGGQTFGKPDPARTAATRTITPAFHTYTITSLAGATGTAWRPSTHYPLCVMYIEARKQPREHQWFPLHEDRNSFLGHLYTDSVQRRKVAHSAPT